MNWNDLTRQDARLEVRQGTTQYQANGMLAKNQPSQYQNQTPASKGETDAKSQFALDPDQSTPLSNLFVGPTAMADEHMSPK